jgi:hypothetical protein
VDNFFQLFGLIAIIVIPVMLIIWSRQKKRLGTIKCKRCHHVGAAKGLFVPFRGMKPVCAKCQSDDWVAVD